MQGGEEAGGAGGGSAVGLRAVTDLELATQDLHDQSAAQRGQVVVACIPPLMSLVMPQVIRRLEASHPSVDIRLRDVLSSQLDGLVARGEAEIGIHAGSAVSVGAFQLLADIIP